MRFYIIDAKPPIRALRKDKAFVNLTVPNVVGFPIFKGIRKPSSALWDGTGLRELRVLTYPVIRPEQWFTYKRNGDGKVKKLTLEKFLAEYEPLVLSKGRK